MNEITITREQFMNAVKSANEKVRDIGKKGVDENEVNPMTLLLVSLQNLAFGSLLGDELFNKNNEENTEDK